SNTYHYNSGGEPEVIPTLTYEQLKAFHATHYHPSNAVFMTYGTFPLEEHQHHIEALALARFTRQNLRLDIPNEPRLSEPVAVDAPYPVEQNEDTEGKTHVVIGWLLGESADLREAMHAHLLTDVLLDNSASPLRHALETSELGSAPSELCGLEADLKEIVFACGLEGSDPDKAEAVEKLVLGVLEDVAQNGVPQDQVESVLHQLELSQREIGGGRFPYGLQLMVRALPSMLHGADPIETLDLDPVLSELREEIKDPGFIKSLARKLLLDNAHRVRLTMYPDKTLTGTREEAVKQRLAAVKDAMSDRDKARVVELAAALKARQEAQDDPEILPKVSIEDVPPTLEIPEASTDPVAGLPATWFTQPTNGLVYEQIVIDLPQLDEELLDDLPLFSECLTEVGCGELDYRDVQAWQAAVSGGVSARVSARAKIEDTQQATGVFVLAGNALVRNQAKLAELLRETISKARFDELPRLRELVSQGRAYRESHITGSGHVLAMTAASAGMGPVGRLAQRWSGLSGIKSFKDLDKRIENDAELTALAARLERIREAILGSPRQLLTVGESEHQDALKTALTEQWRTLEKASEAIPAFNPPPYSAVVKQAWSTNTQVNFCAKAYPSVPLKHADAPALMVLGPFLGNGFLHRTIREQGGAYGSGANYNSDSGAFRFFSYRDPRLEETLGDFDRALDWLHNEKHQPRELEEAILNVISDIDRPDSPANEAIGTFFSTLHGRTPEQRRQFRHKILEVTLEDLRGVAERYLKPEAASVAVISNAPTLEKHPELGLQLMQL
ncbi:MAG: insulinase family protein, partial [Pseudomonadota bacterium]